MTSPSTPGTTSGTSRQDLRDAAHAFQALVAQVPPDAWDRPALGVWTVRELVGHTGRALRTIEEYVTAAGHGSTPDGALVVDAVAYFRLGRTAGITNSGAVAERGRQAGRELGPEPGPAVTELVGQVLALVDATPDDVPVIGRLGTMRLVDYLPTRTFELVVHGLDLQVALGLPLRTPAGPLASMLAVATRLAVEQGLGPRLLLALTGRRPLPEDTCIL